MKTRLRGFFSRFLKARFLLACLAFFGVAGFFLIASREPRRSNVVERTTDALRSVRVAELAKDSDADGLKDWEEAIYRTDVAAADTDGDGIPDGEEITLGRDPTRPGPDDLLATSTPFAEAELAPSSPENLTERLALKFNERFVVPFLANPDRFPSAELFGAVAVEEALGILPQAFDFTNQDLRFVNDNSAKAIRTYWQSFEAAVALAFRGLEKPDIQIFAEAIQTEDFSRLTALDPYLTAYETMIAKLKLLETPTELASLHLAYLNAASRQREAVRKMRNAEQDIVSAIVAAQEYVATFEELRNIATQLRDEFQRRGVTL